jgi:hypothetical protein
VWAESLAWAYHACGDPSISESSLALARQQAKANGYQLKIIARRPGQRVPVRSARELDLKRKLVDAHTLETRGVVAQQACEWHLQQVAINRIRAQVQRQVLIKQRLRHCGVALVVLCIGYVAAFAFQTLWSLWAMLFGPDEATETISTWGARILYLAAIPWAIRYYSLVVHRWGAFALCLAFLASLILQLPLPLISPTASLGTISGYWFSLEGWAWIHAWDVPSDLIQLAWKLICFLPFPLVSLLQLAARLALLGAGIFGWLDFDKSWDEPWNQATMKQGLVR